MNGEIRKLQTEYFQTSIRKSLSNVAFRGADILARTSPKLTDEEVMTRIQKLLTKYTKRTAKANTPLYLTKQLEAIRQKRQKVGW